MKLQILFEDQSIPEIADIIKRDCDFTISQFKNSDQQLFRGLTHPPGKTFYKKKSRLANRESEMLSPEYHESMNTWLNDKYGHPYRNAVFASTNLQMTDLFGSNTGAIFPIGKFEYLYPSATQDLSNDMITNSKDTIDATVEENLKKAKFIHNNNITNTNGNELMIWVDYYHVIDFKLWKNNKDEFNKLIYGR